MASRYSIERKPPSLSHCDCCGGLTVRLTRFVTRDDSAFAVYYTRYSNNHPENELYMLISVGTWGEGSTPSGRSAFFCRVRPKDGSYVVSLANADESPWAHATILGRQLSREDALAHPMKTTVFEILDDAFVHDPTLVGWWVRSTCEGAAPLERTFGLPDDVFRISEPERARRAEVGPSSVVLDGERFFVRCLLPCEVEGYGTWSYGIWVEVSRAEHDRVRAAWADDAAYPALRFAGTLANDLGDEGLSVAAGAPLELAVRDPKSKPFVHASTDPHVRLLVERRWSRAEFEPYAVDRGYL